MSWQSVKMAWQGLRGLERLRRCLLPVGVAALLAIVLSVVLRGLWGGLFPGERTTYAPGYSESVFLTIREGMTRSEVLGRLGPPIYQYFRVGHHLFRVGWYTTDGSYRPPFSFSECIWEYSVRGSASDTYNVRSVIFSEDWTVTAVRRTRYYD